MFKRIMLIGMAFILLQTTAFALWGTDSTNRKDSGQQEQQQDYRPFEHLSKELSLTPDQIKEIDKISIKFEKDNLPFITRRKELNIQMKELMLEDSPDQTKIKDLIREIGKVDSTLKENRVDGMFAVVKLLTPEQKSKLKDMRLFGGLLGGNMYDRPMRDKAKNR